MGEPDFFSAGDMFGDYVIVKLLGKGGMGAVYLAKSVGGNALYAIKVMVPPDGPQRHEWRQRFVREAEFAMRIRHNNLVSVYDVGEDPATNYCYIIMEYVPGGSLSDKIKAQGRLDIRTAIDITIKIASALDAAHKAGVVHRDVKPDNIMFDADGSPKLSDLGVAKVTGSDDETNVTMTGMILGTPAYMSPEQMMNSHDVDGRADIYSLGMVLYEMLTGRRPNDTSTIVQLLAKAIQGEELPDVRTVRPEVSVAVSYVLSKMVAVKPEARPASAMEVARLLFDAATGRLIVKQDKEMSAPPRKGPVQRGGDAMSRSGEGVNVGGVAKWVVTALGVAALWAAVFFGARSLNAPKKDGKDVTRPMVVTNTIERVVRDTPLVVTNVVERTKLVTNDVERASENATVVLVPRLDRDPKAWAYSFEWQDGWTNRDFDDSNWKRGRSGFGFRTYQCDFLRFAHIMSDWRSENLFLRRHFKWSGDAGNISRVVADMFVDDAARIYLNGKKVYSWYFSRSYWMPHEIPLEHFASALSPGDNVLCIEAINFGSVAYIDCGIMIECGGKVERNARRQSDGIHKVSTGAGTWTVKIENGVAQIGDGSHVALSPRPFGALEIPSELGGFSIREIADSAFRDCGELTKVNICEGIHMVRPCAFIGCGKLKSVTLPDSLEFIGCEAFCSTALKSVDLKNVRLLQGGMGVFENCRDLTKVSVSKDNPVLFSKDGVIYDRQMRAVVFCPRERTSFKIPNGIEQIQESAFQYSRIRSVVIPDTVRCVGRFAWGGCRNLESVEFKGDDALIGGRAFRKRRS